MGSVTQAILDRSAAPSNPSSTHRLGRQTRPIRIGVATQHNLYRSAGSPTPSYADRRGHPTHPIPIGVGHPIQPSPSFTDRLNHLANHSKIASVTHAILHRSVALSDPSSTHRLTLLCPWAWPVPCPKVHPELEMYGLGNRSQARRKHGHKHGKTQKTWTETQKTRTETQKTSKTRIQCFLCFLPLNRPERALNGP